MKNFSVLFAATALTIFLGLPVFATEPPVIVGLITKTDTNPFFAKMKAGAQLGATVHNIRLMTASGREDGDVASQAAAINSMVAAGATTLLITPSDAKALVPAIEQARAKGVQVIALDSPTDPVNSVDAVFGTDNFQAGEAIGRYARAIMPKRFPGQPLKIAMLDLSPGNLVGARRHNGFMNGLGLSAAGSDSYELSQTKETVCSGSTGGAQQQGHDVMAACLKAHPDINLVYTINEPAAAGAFKALREAAKERSVLLVSIDGGCEAIKSIGRGEIAATAQQYPLTMAAMGVDAAVAYVRHGKKVSGFINTGTTLIAARPASEVPVRTVADGMNACFGAK